MKYDVLILGGGPAGLAAALYAKRAGVSVLVLERSIYGGQVTNTPTVENYPGILNISGVDLAMALYEQVTGLGIEVRLEEPVSYQLDAPAKAVATARGLYEAKAVIVANGVKRRTLGCPGEERLAGRGVSYCATCDGAFFQGAEVAIVGGGNTALEDALFLSNNCAAVHLIHRRDQFRGSSILAEAVKKRQNIHLHLNSVVEEITGEEKVAGARLRDVTTGEETRLELSGVFVAVGLAPDNAAFAGQLALDGAGYIQAGEDCRTNLAGVFAAGDTRTKEVRQIITAAADGAVAALGAANYVNSLE
ncbi:MAG: FAD-dependent oxidoreductase [Angelakisella sp.]|jgi:thioredoxin reductase (NADPH)|nr:FAD-dependent oxidoreductase [Angelakisella sp.]